MDRKDVLELRKRFTRENCSFTRFSACFVDYNKDIVLNINESFLSLEDEELFKYLEITKKVLSGSMGNSLLKLDFSNQLEGSDSVQSSLFKLKKSKLKDQELLDSFYRSIIDNYDYDENYIIFLFHDVYDIPKRSRDNISLNDSDEIFEYIICALCPVELSEPGLGYFEDENTIKSRLRDWLVTMPINGFLYPAFIDRTSDVNSLLYYTKNTKNIHSEFITDILSCSYKETLRLQKDRFKGLMTDGLTQDQQEAENIYMDIQDNLNNLILDERALMPNTDIQAIALTQDKLEDILVDSELDPLLVNELKSSYLEAFDNNLPNAEDLLDRPTLKKAEFRKKEQNLKKEIKSLKKTLKLAKPEEDPDLDIIIRARQNRLDDIESKLIDGKKYLLIPIEDSRYLIDEIKKD